MGSFCLGLYPPDDGEPPWFNDPDERSTFDPNFDEFGDYTQKAIQTLSILDDSSSALTPYPTFMVEQSIQWGGSLPNTCPMKKH